MASDYEKLMAEFGYNANPMDSLTQILEMSNKMAARKKTKISSSLNSLNNLILSSATDEQISNAELAISNMDATASRYNDTDFQHQALVNLAQNKRNHYDDYKIALDATADFINSGLYITSAEDWQDLDALYKKKVDTEGKPLYDSVADMMSQEFSKLGALQIRTQAGRDRGFYHKGALGKDGKLDENSIMQKMEEYTTRLDTAMVTLIGDGTITDQEASMIMQGMSKQDFINFRNEKLGNIERQIVNEQSVIRSLNSMIDEIDIDEKVGVGSEEIMNYLNFLNQDEKSDETTRDSFW